MAQKEIELILSRHLAEYLAMPIFIVDQDGDLVYYNDSAEMILGSRYEETGTMRVEEWSTVFKPMDHDGKQIEPEELPLVIALTDQRPAHKRFWIRGLDGNERQIELTAFPLIAQADRFLGAFAIFWEVAG